MSAMQNTAVVQPNRRKSLKQWLRSMRGQQILVTLVFLFVPLLLLVTFTYLPFFKMVQFSFFSMRYIGRRTFVGLQNYIDVFTRDDIFHALMMGTDVITIYIFLQFFENLSPSLDESAILDGCTYFGVFFKILLPLLKPAIVTSAILKGVGTYNEYYMANLYLQDKTRYQVVSTSLYVFSGPMGSQYNYICAGVIITIIPALIIFLLCQDQIYSGMAAGAVKG